MRKHRLVESTQNFKKSWCQVCWKKINRENLCDGGIFLTVDVKPDFRDKKLITSKKGNQQLFENILKMIFFHIRILMANLREVKNTESAAKQTSERNRGNSSAPVVVIVMGVVALVKGGDTRTREYWLEKNEFEL